MGQFVARPSGLLVPRGLADEAGPLDLVYQYLTAKEVLGFQPPLEWVEDQLSRVAIDDVLNFAAAVLAVLHRPGLSRRDVDEVFLPQ